MTKSNILLVICLIFIGGLFLISIFEYPQSIWGYLFSENNGKNQVSCYNDSGKKISFLGEVIEEPDIRSSNAKLTVETKILEVQGEQKEISGKVLVTTGKYPRYQYGDELIIIGKLETPIEFEDFNYKGYLAKEGIYSVIYYPKIKPSGKNLGNFFYKAIFSFKDKVKQAVEKIMPLPEISILEALTLGSKKGLSEDLKNQLNITGTRHIVAISGMHIMILSQVLMFLLIGLGLWRGQAFYFTMAILILFIIMIGAPASAVRAGIMGGILLFAQKIGRLNNSGRTIVFTGAIMLALNPLLLKFDVGFQLSFLAVLGIIYLKPIFDGWLNKLLFRRLKSWIEKGRLRQEVRSIITMTFAAQIATLPILIYNFGRISFISPLANVLIVPALPYVMGAGFIFNLGAVTWLFLGKILIWPVWFMFAYITKLLELLSKIPFAAKEISNVHWLWPVGYYVLLIGFFWWYKKKKQNKINEVQLR